MDERTNLSRKIDSLSQDKEIAELRAEIEQTRADMRRTVFELQERLSPSNIKSELKERLRNATVRRTEKVKGNLPLILAGIGLGWYVIQHRRGNGAGGHYYDKSIYEEGSAGEEFEGAGEEESLEKKGLAEKGRELSGKASRRIGEAKERAAEKAKELSENVRERSYEYRERAREKAVEARGSFEDALDSNPLGVALGFFGLGILAGLLIPETDKEMEFGREVGYKAGEKVRTTMEKAATVAEEAKESAAAKAKEEGLI